MGGRIAEQSNPRPGAGQPSSDVVGFGAESEVNRHAIGSPRRNGPSDLQGAVDRFVQEVAASSMKRIDPRPSAGQPSAPVEGREAECQRNATRVESGEAPRSRWECIVAMSAYSVRLRARPCADSPCCPLIAVKWESRRMGSRTTGRPATVTAARRLPPPCRRQESMYRNARAYHWRRNASAPPRRVTPQERSTRSTAPHPGDSSDLAEDPLRQDDRDHSPEDLDAIEDVLLLGAQDRGSDPVAKTIDITVDSGAAEVVAHLRPRIPGEALVGVESRDTLPSCQWRHPRQTRRSTPHTARRWQDVAS